MIEVQSSFKCLSYYFFRFCTYLNYNTATLINYHNKFGHMSFRKLKQMALQGIIPTRLTKCRTLVCTACTYAKMTKRKWRVKSPTTSIPVEPDIQPGDIVSVDQLISSASGLIAQMTGILRPVDISTPRFMCTRHQDWVTYTCRSHRT